MQEKWGQNEGFGGIYRSWRWQVINTQKTLQCFCGCTSDIDSLNELRMKWRQSQSRQLLSESLTDMRTYVSQSFSFFLIYYHVTLHICIYTPIYNFFAIQLPSVCLWLQKRRSSYWFGITNEISQKNQITPLSNLTPKIHTSSKTWNMG